MKTNFKVGSLVLCGIVLILVLFATYNLGPKTGSNRSKAEECKHELDLLQKKERLVNDHIKEKSSDFPISGWFNKSVRRKYINQYKMKCGDYLLDND